MKQSTLRVWDFFFAQGSAFLFKFSLSALQHFQSDIMRSKDPSEFFSVRIEKTRSWTERFSAMREDHATEDEESVRSQGDHKTRKQMG